MAPKGRKTQRDEAGAIAALFNLITGDDAGDIARWVNAELEAIKNHGQAIARETIRELIKEAYRKKMLQAIAAAVPGIVEEGGAENTGD
jgi:hypothetical protein